MDKLYLQTHEKYMYNKLKNGSKTWQPVVKYYIEINIYRNSICLSVKWSV